MHIKQTEYYVFSLFQCDGHAPWAWMTAPKSWKFHRKMTHFCYLAWNKHPAPRSAKSRKCCKAYRNTLIFDCSGGRRCPMSLNDSTKIVEIPVENEAFPIFTYIWTIEFNNSLDSRNAYKTNEILLFSWFQVGGCAPWAWVTAPK